ncbi:hypothetical protein PUNSTDRAFT_128963 [Punctularia strigosozonata HHB-11173 SS5]|uniref:uncharacterized protein n=1 Tax=Punctularia strigosozonata (strain HHB-11173) TaxID=741275 RepID=UPI0004417339|nr:uncharacterized protein PUNSTDRAFT_128963 [Punctularia strigosozonata HHB-11173 SS5]EIN13276.1 hypothetical protein PUNSTDRAFT_128963 [Punctularia strigosozonata HHB-11173 SS5]
MPRKLKGLSGPTQLSKVLAFLTRDPKPTLNAVSSLRLTYAARNNHWGARHFVKEDLPRIRYANPNVDIAVNKVQAGLEDVVRPELVIERRNGTKETISMDSKHSTKIFEELMNKAGGANWERWCADREAGGLPIVESVAPPKTNRQRKTSLQKERQAKPKGKASQEPTPEPDYDKPDFTKTGAAVVLP